MNMELFYRNLQRMEQLTEMRRIQDEQRKFFTELTKTTTGKEPDPGAVGKYPGCQYTERLKMGVWKYFAGCDAFAGNRQTVSCHGG